MKKLVKQILTWTNIFLAFLLILSYASNFISPEKIWILAFFGLAYPFLLLLNLFFLIFWLWLRKKLFLISLMAILLGINNIGKYIQLNVSRNNSLSAKNCIKVLSYNVRIFNYYRWHKEKMVRDSILNFVRDQEPDILCFQEFHTTINPSESEAYLKERLNNTPNSHIAYLNYNSSSKVGLATFTSKNIADTGQINFKGSVNFAIYTDIVDNHDTLRVYNVHLQSISLNKQHGFTIDSLKHINNQRIDDMKDITSRLRYAFIKRAQQAKILADHIEKSPYPVILCGDFNDTPISYTYHTLLGSMKDAFRQSGRGVGKTYRGNFPSYRIDYVFHSKGLKSIHFNTFPVKYSDHLPVMTCLETDWKGR